MLIDLIMLSVLTYKSIIWHQFMAFCRVNTGSSDVTIVNENFMGQFVWVDSIDCTVLV